MSQRPVKLGRNLRVALGIAAVCLAGFQTLHAQRRAGQAIEFSAPRGGGAGTNLSDADLKKLRESELRQQVLEDPGHANEIELRNKFAAPMQPPERYNNTQGNRRTKTANERLNDLILQMPDNPGRLPTLEQLFNLQPRNATEQQALDRANATRDGAVNPNSADRRNEVRDGVAPRNDDRANNQPELNPLERRLNQSENALKDIFDGNRAGDILSQAAAADSASPFDTGTDLPGAADRTAAQKVRMEMFRQLLEPRQPEVTVASPAARNNPLIDATPASATMDSPFGSPLLPSLTSPNLLEPPAPPGMPSAKPASAYKPYAPFNPSSERSVTVQPVTPIPQRKF